MEDLSIGQVVLATFPFSDLSSTKLRPCYVIGLSGLNDVVLCQITSKPYHDNNVVTLKKSDFSRGSIVVDSYIRVDKIATIHRARIKRALGSVNQEKLDEVKNSLKAFLEIH